MPCRGVRGATTVETNSAAVLRPFKLASREFHPQDTIGPVNGISIGGKRLAVVAGPCAVERQEQLLETARARGLRPADPGRD